MTPEGPRRVALVCARQVPIHSAAAARLLGIEAAFQEAGWDVERLFSLDDRADNATYKPVRRLLPKRLRAALSRIGGVGEIRPGELVHQTLALRRDVDLVIVSIPPFSLLAATAVAVPPVLLDYRDVLSVTPRPHRLGRMLGPLERRLAARAAGAVFAGAAEGVDLLRAAAGLPEDRVRLVPNGVLTAELGLLDRPERKGSGPLDLALVGHLYGGSDLTPLLRVLAAVGPDVARLEVIGPTSPGTRDRFGDADGAAVRFSGPLHRAALHARLLRADAGVLVLNDAYPHEVSVPAKLYDYAAAALPVVYVGPPEAAFLREDLGVPVHAYDPSHGPSLGGLLRAAAGDRGALGGHGRAAAHLDRVARAQPLIRLAEEVCA